MVYAILIAILLYGYIHYGTKRIDNGNRYLYFEYIAIVLIFGLRYKVGGDTINYFYEFDWWPSLSQLSSYDYTSTRYNIGWVIFAAICKSIYNDFVVIQIVQCAIVNAAFFYFFKKHTNNYFAANLFYGIMYLITFNTELLRASISVSIFLFGFSTYLRKQWVKYYLLAILAILFHNEATIMLILPICYPLSKIRTDIPTLGILWLISVVSVAVLDLIPHLLAIFSVSETLLTAYSVYSEKVFEANMNGFIAQTFFLMPWFYFLWLTKDEKKPYWRGFIIALIFLSFQELRYLIVMSRACDFLYPFTIILMTIAIDKFKVLKDPILRFGVTLGITIALCSRVYGFVADEHWKLFYPYSSVIAPEDNMEREMLLLEFQAVQS